MTSEEREEAACRYLTEKVAHDLRANAPAGVTVVDVKGIGLLVDVKGQKVMVGMQACQ